MIQIRDEHDSDFAARERLLDSCFGPSRFAKTSERLREGRLPADRLALTAERNRRVVGTVRLWHVAAGSNRPALLLGPLAVDPALQGCGLGAALMRESLGRARALGHEAVLLVGDAPYYARFGFDAGEAERLWLPGPFERHRLLGLDLRSGALDGAEGLVRATGAYESAPARSAEIIATVAARRRAA